MEGGAVLSAVPDTAAGYSAPESAIGERHILSAPMDTSRLNHFPISWFAMIMGLSGFSIAWIRAGQILHLSFPIGFFLLSLTIALFIGDHMH
jgi:hypothetical protein